MGRSTATVEVSMKKLFFLIFLLFPFMEIVSDGEADSQYRYKCLSRSNIDLLIYEGCYELVKDKIEQGYDVNTRFEDGETPLSTAVSVKDIKIIKLLLEKGAFIHPNCDDYPCHSPYMKALYNGNLEIVQLFIAAGAPVNMLSDRPYGNFICSTLFEAVQSGNLKLVQYMIEKGADINGFGSHNPILAVTKAEILEFLILKKGDIFAFYEDEGSTLFHIIARPSVRINTVQERKKIVQILISYGVPADITTDNGRTPLMISAIYNDIFMTMFLIRQGADPALKDKHGKTALDYARERGHTEIVEYLESIKSTTP